MADILNLLLFHNTKGIPQYGDKVTSKNKYQSIFENVKKTPSIRATKTKFSLKSSNHVILCIIGEPIRSFINQSKDSDYKKQQIRAKTKKVKKELQNNHKL